LVKAEILIGIIGIAVLLAVFLPLTFDPPSGGDITSVGGGGFDNFEYARAGDFLGIDPASPKIFIEVFDDYKTKIMEFKFGEPIFQDSLSRNDSQTLGVAELGGTWVEHEPTLTNARIFNNTIEFDTENLVLFAPAISNDFATQTNGTVFWEFDWDFVREFLTIFFDDYNRADNNDENANSNFNYTSHSEKEATTSIQISQSSDDAEEGCDVSCPNPQQTAMDLTSGDLDLDATFWTVGLRFNNVNLPQGATIENATVQFTAQASDSGALTINVFGEDIDDAPTFTTTAGDITSRTQTTASVSWVVADWTAGDMTTDQETPNLAPIINEIIGRGGWVSGNSIVIIFERPATGERDAESFDASPTDAPILKIIEASGDDAWRILSNQLDAQTDELPFESYIHHNFTKQQNSTIVWEFDFDFVRGGLAGGGTQQFSIQQVDDDAEEEVATGGMSLGSSDLEIVDEGGSTNQFVGVRFDGVTIMQGETVTDAYIQFTVDDTNSGVMNATVFGEDIDNSPVFNTTNSNISDRTKTGNSTDWFLVPAWNTIGEAGVNQRTTDLSPIVNEILARGGWASGNAMTFIFNGTGEREAEAFPTGEAVLVTTQAGSTNGTDTDYEVFMQLGESAQFFCLDCAITTASQLDDGVAVNLKWGDNNSGCTDESCIATRDDLSDTQFGTINNADSGTTHFVVTVDLNSNTYDVLVTGAGLESGTGNATGIAFEENVDIDTFRFVTNDQECDTSCLFDNVEIKVLEDDYEMFMQLGDSASMVFPVTNSTELDQGVAVNLKYGDTNSGCATDACIATRNNGTDTEFAVIDGFTEFFIRADIDSDTYNVEVAGVGVQSGASFANNVPFENNVEIDTVRFILSEMNPDGFSVQELDNISLSNEFSIQRAHWASTLPPEFSASSDIDMELYWYVDVDPSLIDGDGVCWKVGISGFEPTDPLPTFTTQDFKTSCFNNLNNTSVDELVTNTFSWTSSEFTLDGEDFVIIEVRRDLLDVTDDWEEVANMLGLRMRWT
jgi:hypothetical protein